ncbi:hypothetical protein AB1Y20_006975 [Prymnesium parvum]|uniref:RIIa domain-containing protein n=1 Tax=Prymnesium parvum TaxID=97485 RepID=A0AB34IZZ0_PRYPA
MVGRNQPPRKGVVSEVGRPRRAMADAEASAVEASAAPRRRSADDPQLQAEEYLAKHQLKELFEMLGQRLVREQPDDPRTFLVSYLEELASSTNKTSPMNFFTDQDITTLFSMYDQQKKGITPAQCREALNAIGLEDVEVPDSARIDLNAFRQLIPSA